MEAQFTPRQEEDSRHSASASVDGGLFDSLFDRLFHSLFDSLFHSHCGGHWRSTQINPRPV